MAVIAMWKCDRDGSMFEDKKAADEHDKMLELGEVFSRLLQKVIPERTPEKTQTQKQWQQARKAGEPIAGLSEWNARWVGPEGYKGMVAKQLQEFKKRQKELHGNLPQAAHGDAD